MRSSLHILLLGTLAVAMVASAPLTNQEKLVNVEQAGEAVDRAKRAEEEIVFGNQQNKARVVAKKSDLSNLLAAPAPQGERDQGSEVIVHKEMPVTEDLAARAEAAVGSASDNNEKMKEAVEEAIQTVVEAEAEPTNQDSTNKVETEEKVVKQTADEEIEENEQGAGEVSEIVEEKEDEDDKDLKALQKTAEGYAPTEEGSQTESDDVKVDNEEVQNFLHGSTTEEGDTGLDRDREKSYYENQMRNYLLSLTNKQGLSSIMSRFRRSLQASKNSATSNNKRNRRIKRDLFDDSYYGPYVAVPYSPEDDDALISSSNPYSQLSDEQAQYLYKELVDNLAEEEEQDHDESPLDSYFNGYESEDQEEPFVPYGIFSENSVPIIPGSYGVGYPYDSPVDFDSYQNYAKRGMVDYFPAEEEKRYFFPFSKEPETHWGAFVPEKRNYGEAIQRLQRLAMALSDNPEPYYREILEEYKRK